MLKTYSLHYKTSVNFPTKQKIFLCLQLDEGSRPYRQPSAIHPWVRELATEWQVNEELGVRHEICERIFQRLFKT